MVKNGIFLDIRTINREITKIAKKFNKKEKIKILSPIWFLRFGFCILPMA
jgi:hypothetical protein